MAMTVTVKEAKQLIVNHKSLLSNLEFVVSKAFAAQRDVQHWAYSLVSQGGMEQIVLAGCAQSSEALLRTAGLERLIYLLYKYQMIQHAYEVALNYQECAAANVQQNMALLNPGLVGLAWVFRGKRAQEQVTQAYHALSIMLQGNYGQDIPQLVSKVMEADGINIEDAWRAFEESPQSFADTLNLLCQGIMSAKGKNPFQRCLSRIADLEVKIAVSGTALNKETEQIKIAASRMIAFNALQILRAVPVEELNREKLGLRVKTLREAGFTSMADIYAATPYQLSSLYGISDNAAFSMKRIAKRCLEEAQVGTKIKLSADDRNPQATQLIKCICAYRAKLTSKTELVQIVAEKRASLTKAKKLLSSVGNGLAWLFYTVEQRLAVRDAYVEMQSLIDGEYAQKIEKLTHFLSLAPMSPLADVAWGDFLAYSIEYISILEEIVPGVLGNDDNLYGLPEDLAREIQEEAFFPDGLLCTLRRYQEWGVKYILHQKRVLLGDEMGLGKTVQAIATMVSLRNTGATHFIVVCPASVVTNWCREVARHSKLRVTKIHGTGRSQAIRSWAKTGGVAVTTFETTAYITDDSVSKIDLLIVDEAHYIKNEEARRTINVKRLCSKTERLLFMTGTALENKVEEMVSLINILQPSIAATVSNMTFMPNAPQFRSRVAPVYYRRKREDVLTELPDLIETKEWCILNPDEQEIYENNVLDKHYAAARRLSWNATDLTKSCKAIRLLEIIEEAKLDNRKVLVFSFFLDTIGAIGRLLGDCCYGPINGSVSPAHRQEIIDAFNEAPAGSVLLAQIQSGGTGLNIQSASVVVICEPQFKPSIENQAVSRAYRMGQARNVLVYRLLCVNTIDEKITELLEQKQEIFDAFADRSVAAEQNEAHEKEIDEKKFGQLIQEEIDRINKERGVVVK